MGETISSSRMRDWLSASAPPQEMRIAPNSETPKGRRSRSLYKCALARFDTDALSKTCGLPQQIQPPILFLLQPTVHIFDMTQKRAAIEKQIASLKATSDKKLAQLQARLKAEKARGREKQRKLDTRRKIIAGALALEHMDRNPDTEFARIMDRMIEQYTLGDRERALFNLPPLPEDEQQSRRARHTAERRRKK